MYNHQPLAYRMRPKYLKDIRGQEHIIDNGQYLSRLIRSNTLTNMLLYGPPGTGKTTIANAIANEIKIPFVSINATTASKKDMQNITEKYEHVILFIDEIHRFNKAQQDYLLPFLESGQIILIGATTENPYFSVNPAILSRCSSAIFELKPLDKKATETIINDALVYLKNEKKINIICDNDAISQTADYANGDARTAINAIELAVLTTPPDTNGNIHITKEIAANCLQKPVLRYDRDGDEHYNTISAFIKSIRGSDPQAALYYLALMINAGEDPVFIARRIVIAASEDIGLADSNALNIAVSAFTAVKNIGYPESNLILSHAVIYLATAPKSNSACKAIQNALYFTQQNPAGTIPAYLKDAHYKGAEKLGRGIDYKYPHDYPNHYIPQEYMPQEYQNLQFYKPCDNQNEITIEKYMNFISYLKQKEREKR